MLAPQPKINVWLVTQVHALKQHQSYVLMEIATQCVIVLLVEVVQLVLSDVQMELARQVQQSALLTTVAQEVHLTVVQMEPVQHSPQQLTLQVHARLQ